MDAIPDNWSALMSDYRCSNLHCQASELTVDQAKAVRAAGYGLYCYTVNDEAEAHKLWGMGAHGVFTDFPERLLRSLGT